MKQAIRVVPVAELLAGMPWVQALPPAARDRVEDAIFASRYAKGNAVARVGDPSASWIYVAEGLLKVSASDRWGRVIMYTGVSPGGWIGEGSVIKREPRRYDVYALRETRLLHLPTPTFHWLMETSLTFNHFIVSHLNERLSQYISTVETDRLEDPVARVARSLAMLFNPVLNPNMPAAVPLSQSELGDLVGLHRQSVNMALRRLQEEGHIATVYGGVFVKDLAALRHYESASERTLPQPSVLGEIPGEVARRIVGRHTDALPGRT